MHLEVSQLLGTSSHHVDASWEHLEGILGQRRGILRDLGGILGDPGNSWELVGALLYLTSGAQIGTDPMLCYAYAYAYACVESFYYPGIGDLFEAACLY